MLWRISYILGWRQIKLSVGFVAQRTQIMNDFTWIVTNNGEVDDDILPMGWNDDFERAKISYLPGLLSYLSLVINICKVFSGSNNILKGDCTTIIVYVLLWKVLKLNSSLPFTMETMCSKSNVSIYSLWQGHWQRWIDQGHIWYSKRILLLNYTQLMFRIPNCISNH